MREADALVILFTKKAGKVTVSGRSVLKATSRFAGITQPYNHLHVVLYAKSREQEIWTLTQAALVRDFGSIQGDLGRMAYAACLAEWVDALSGEFESSLRTWDVLIRAFERWDATPPRPAELVQSQWRLLAEAGVQPEVGACIRCGREENASWLYSAEEGGIGCPSCIEKGTPVAAGSLQALREIVRTGFPPPVRLSRSQWGEIDRMLQSHVEFHVGIPFRSASFFRRWRSLGGEKTRSGPGEIPGVVLHGEGGSRP